MYVMAFGGGELMFLTLSVCGSPVAFHGIGDGVGYETKRKLLFLVGMEFRYKACS